MPSAAIIELSGGACRSGRNTSRSSAAPATASTATATAIAAQ